MDPHLGVHGSATSPDSKASSPNGDKPKLRHVERGSQACNECRRHKIRCHPASDDPDHTKPCARCVRMSLECVFKKHNRGRKRKNPPPGEGTESPAAKHAVHDAKGAGVPSASRGGQAYWASADSPERGIFSSAVARYPFMTLDAPPRDTEHPVPVAQSIPQSMSLRSMVHATPWDGDDDDDGFVDEPTPREVERGRIVQSPQDIRVRDQSHDRRPQSSHSFAAANGHGSSGDPVSLGYLSLEDARSLFAIFLKNFNQAMPILDPFVHTHDVVRQQSAFLYTVILCITTRFMAAIGHPAIPLSHNAVHQQIVVLARDHLMWSFAEAVSTIDVVQAILALCLWKEPDDDKAAYYFNRAVILARELDLGREPPAAEYAQMSPAQKLDIRHRQRLWMSLFSTNSIFHMQFRQPMLIPPTDPLVASCTFWLKHADADHVLQDTFIAFSADLRRRFLHYRELLTDGPPPSALNLSVMTRTMNKEWETSSEAWIREIIDAGGSPSYVHKPRVWYSSLGLNLNLMILNQTLRIPPAERIPPASPHMGHSTAGQMRSIPAFHHCLNAASTVLLRFGDLDRSQLSYASDTLLHFALYAATFLWTLCRTPELYDFETAEVEYTRELIMKVAQVLDEASFYPNSSPALHAKYLRKLCRTQGRGQSGYSADGVPPQELPVDGVESAIGVPQIGGGFENPYGAPVPAPGQTPGMAMGELDFLLGDFPWVGVELPWPPVDPALFGPGGAPPPVGQQHAPHAQHTQHAQHAQHAPPAEFSGYTNGRRSSPRL